MNILSHQASHKNAEKFINKYINGVREVPLIRSSRSKRIIWFNFAESGNGDLKQISSFLYFHSQKKNLFFIYVAFTITITISKWRKEVLKIWGKRLSGLEVQKNIS